METTQLDADSLHGVVRRLSDGKILQVIGESKGPDWDEIRVVEAFPFWSPSGTVMKPLKMWHPRSRYEPCMRNANQKLTLDAPSASVRSEETP